MIAKAAKTDDSVQYFAFSVPSGYYVYSSANSATNSLKSWAFYVPPHQAVYLGDFISSPQEIEQQINIDEAQRAMRTIVREELLMANEFLVNLPRTYIYIYMQSLIF